MIQLREYRPSDLERLWQLDQQCFSEDIAYSREELAYYLRNRTAVCLLALRKQRLLGFILGHRDRRGFGHIITLDVHPEVRRAGLGSTLMNALETRFHDDGCTTMLLEVAVNNRGALEFYKRQGFSVWKTLRQYYPNGLNALLMGKQLQSEQGARASGLPSR